MTFLVELKNYRNLNYTAQEINFTTSKVRFNGAGDFGQRYVNPKVGRAKTQKTVELRARARANPKDGRA